MQVDELMTKRVWTCSPQDTLDHAARLLWEQDCGALPIVDRDRFVVGMITDRDICMAAYTKGRQLAHVRVGDVMSRHVHAIRETDPIESALHRMAEFQVRRLPVVDAGYQLIGIVSLSDFARHAHRSGLFVEGPSGDAVSRTLAAIGTRHAATSAPMRFDESHAQAE